MTSTAPDVDVVDLLTTDHHDILDLLASMAEDLDPHAQRDVADTVTAELIRHSVAEEMYVYPAMRDHLPDGEQVVQHDIEEHQELEEALQQWERTDGGTAEFAAARSRVEELLRHHASDEEQEQFPQLRAHIPHDQLVQMGQKVATAKQLAPTRPHPNSPHSELFHKALGPGVGLIDKMRDALSGRAGNT
jgi:hemerythrin superfamily protein